MSDKRHKQLVGALRTSRPLGDKGREVRQGRPRQHLNLVDVDPGAVSFDIVQEVFERGSPRSAGRSVAVKWIASRRCRTGSSSAAACDPLVLRHPHCRSAPRAAGKPVRRSDRALTTSPTRRRCRAVSGRPCRRPIRSPDSPMVEGNVVGVLHLFLLDGTPGIGAQIGRFLDDD